MENGLSSQLVLTNFSYGLVYKHYEPDSSKISRLKYRPVQGHHRVRDCVADCVSGTSLGTIFVLMNLNFINKF